ncbi:MAG: hypothetical protein ABF876_03360 [Acetobacter aceti]|uniref:Uncharacterized protein n=1 Tax=Acetobacter aceti TaxID=435 RepID=A0A1U9KFY6_ACEAC|nr:hypothetical protein [Acetobacter aceti]AQS84711.1 hypothetical protein A0U92_07905 [Acetobacter aceti]
MVAGYYTASDIASLFADPLLLAPDAVRCLWVRPVSHVRGDYVPTVIFRDGTHHPLSSSQVEMEARRVCLRLGVAHDWPVWDARLTKIGYPIGIAESLRTLQVEDHLAVDGQTCLTMPGLGRLLANIAHGEGRFLGESVSKITHQIVLFFDLAKMQTVLTGIALEEAMQATINAGFERLCALYPDEDETSARDFQTADEITVEDIDEKNALVLSKTDEIVLSCQPFILFDQCLALVRSASAKS